MGSRKKDWSTEEQQMLFQLHNQFGNKWALIAARMSGKDDSCVKNKFYSTLRRGLRKVNSYITNVKKKVDPLKYKAFKPLPQLFLTKIIAVVDHNYDQKFQVKPRALDLASTIQVRIAELALSEKQFLKPQGQSYEFQQELLSNIQQFNKSCKKRKGKRKHIDQKQQSSQGQDSPFIAEKLQQSEIVNEPLPQLKKQASSKKNYAHHHPQIAGKIPEGEQKNAKGKSNEVLNISIPLLNPMEKRRSLTTTIISNDSAQFASKAGEFFRIMEDSPFNQSNNMSISHSWISESNNSCDFSKRGQYMLQPSPLPSSDTYSPYTFNNLMANKNITHSSQLDEKHHSIDLFSSGRLPPKKEDQVVSLLDEIPHYEAKSNFLVRSSDLLQSSEMLPGMIDSSCLKEMTSVGSPLEGRLKSENSLNQFLASHNIVLYEANNLDEKMRDYSFGERSEGTENKCELFGSKSETFDVSEKEGKEQLNSKTEQIVQKQN